MGTETFSANSEYQACVWCDDSGTVSVKIVDTPHPTWTDLSGNSVVQLNMVQLGGMNGLNN